MQLESSVTLFDDNKVEDRFAELQVTADGITAEVGRKVGNDEVISRINQSAEAVTINANKINIAGTITAINNNSTTTINGGKITTGTLNANAIGAGDITADRMKVNSISAVNGNTGTVKINAGKLDISGTITAINNDSTTTINGGKITTGTLSASAVNSSSGTFNTANIPDLNASKITAGTITDSSGKNYWNLSNGQFTTQRGTIGLFTATDTKLAYKANNTQIVFRENALSLRQRDHFTFDPSTYYMFGVLINGGNINYYLTNDGDYDTTPIKMKISLHKHNSADNYGVVIKNASNSTVAAFFEGGAYSYPIGLWESTKVNANFSVTGTKSRQVETDNYSSRLLYCYETPTPLFGDIGEAVIEEDGYCYVDIDDIFGEAIASNAEYQVFLQKEGDGDCWIEEKTGRYFTIRGTPNLKVAWELKAKQIGYQNIRLEQPDYGLDEYIYQDETAIEDYISEQEALLYGNY